MKANIINAFKLLVAIFTMAMISTASAFAASTTEDKTIWIFGNANDEGVWSAAYPGYTRIPVTTIGNVTGMDIGTNNAGTMKGTYMHFKQTMTINVNTNGKIHLLAYGRNSSDSGSYSSRTIKVDGNNVDLTGANDTKIASPSAADEHVINIEATEARDVVLNFTGNQWAGVFYVAWEPEVPAAPLVDEYNTSVKTAWVFGTDDSKVVTPAGYTNVLRVNSIPETLQSITVEQSDGNGSYGMTEDYMQTRRSITIHPAAPGYLRVLAKGNNAELGSDVWTQRTLRVTINGVAKTVELAGGKNQGEFVFEIPAACDVVFQGIAGTDIKPIRYYYIAYEPTTEPWALKNSNIRSGQNQALSLLSGTALGLRTDNTVNTSDRITVYDDNGNNIRPDGALTIEAESPLVATQKATSNYDLTATGNTTNGKLKLKWMPGGSSPQSIYDFAIDHATQAAEVHIEEGNHYIYFAGNGYSVNINNTGNAISTGTYKYFYIELTEPTDNAIYIAAEYTDGTNNYVRVPEGSMFLCVPLNPSKTLSYINIGNSEGEVTLHYKSCGFATSSYLPVYAELTGITVSDIISLNHDYTIYDRYNESYLFTTTQNLQGIDGKYHDYIEIPYDYIAVINPKSYKGEISPENEVEVTYDFSSAGFDKDGSDNDYTAFDIADFDEHKKCYITPAMVGKKGRISVYVKNQWKPPYERNGYSVYVIITKATPDRVATPSGAYLNDRYNGNKMGLHTKNSVNLAEKFIVLDHKRNDISQYGTFSYTTENGLTVTDGILTGTATTTGTLTVLWTPMAEYADIYNPITGVIYDIEVKNVADITSITVAPNPITTTEAGRYQITAGEGCYLNSVTVKNYGVEIENPTLTYSVVYNGTESQSNDYIEIVTEGDKQKLVAKKYTGDLAADARPMLRVSWVDGNDYTWTEDVPVNVKMRLCINVNNQTVTQGTVTTLNAEVFNDVNNNKTRDAGEELVTDIEPQISIPAFPDATNNKRSYIAVDRNGDGTYSVTALVPGNGPGIDSGTTTVTLSYGGNDKYNDATDTGTITVNDNSCFDYMGWDLKPEHEGTLFKAGNKNDHYLHWRFAQPANKQVYVTEWVSNHSKYEFTYEALALENEVKDSEKSMDYFSKTRLTSTQEVLDENNVRLSAKGDAFLEYNGMIAGFGTEKGGRYLTPISGTFVRIEAEHDGVVTVRVRHNGSTDGSNRKVRSKASDPADYYNITQARRAIFVIDENGVVMPRTTVNLAALDQSGTDFKTVSSDSYRTLLKGIDGTYACISNSSAVASIFNVVNDAYTAFFKAGSGDTFTVGESTYKIGSGNNHDFSKNAFHFIRSKIYGYTDEQADAFNYTIRSGYNKQELFYSALDTDVEYQAPNVSSKTSFFSKYGYEVLGATHLMISFPVKAGKTYFVGANKSKVGLCSVDFIPSDTYTTKNETLYEDATVENGKNAWLLSTADGTHLNVTLDREFKAGCWHPIVLPFSVSESQLKSVFGENVAVISLDGSLKMLSSMSNYATRDGDFYDTTTIIDGPGIPFNGSVIKPSAIQQESANYGSVTFTRHYYQMIYANCPVFLWTDRNLGGTGQDKAIFNNVTFQKYTLDKTDGANTVAINNDYTVKFPYKVDRQIGTEGTNLDYVMKASYVKTKPTKDIYYINNLPAATTSGMKAYLYHALAGEAPDMKGMRVWIEPGANSLNPAPLRMLRMQHYDGEAFAVDGEDVTGIDDIINDQPNETMYNDDNVYDIMGRIVSRGSLNGLTPGIYIYKGQKHAIK